MQRQYQDSIGKLACMSNRGTTAYPLLLLLCIQIVVQCLNLVVVSKLIYVDPLLGTVKFDPSGYHIFYDPNNLRAALVSVAILAPITALFWVARVSFGYIVAFYLYMVALGYMWLSSFSDLKYDHALYGTSVAAATFAFVLPTLLISSPVRRRLTLSKRAFDNTLKFILLIAAVTVAIGAYYNFRLVGMSSIYEFRNDLDFPRPLKYLLSVNASVLLPFAFAGFVERGNRWGAAAALLLLLLLYPVTLTKVALFAPVWLAFILLLTSLFEARLSLVLSLLLPTLVGLLAIAFGAWTYFLLINFRMVAIPSVALDIYSHYFSSHSYTYFCQIWLLKPLMPCAYQDPLSVVMEGTYHLGFFNASLFATEGIASAGPYLAPVAIFLCGLIIALGSRLSAGLPPRFILTSSAIMAQALLNVPLSTVLLTHGLAILYLLWYITPQNLHSVDEER
ncbi:hypothetical protein [Bradyrhizobium sp. Lot33]